MPDRLSALDKMWAAAPPPGEPTPALWLTSPRCGVYYGWDADRDVMGDVDMLAGMVPESLDELPSSAS